MFASSVPRPFQRCSLFLFHAQLEEFSIGKRALHAKMEKTNSIHSSGSVLREQASLAHDPMNCEPCDMDQVEFSATVFLTKDRKKPAKRLQWSASREEGEGGTKWPSNAPNGPEAFDAVLGFRVRWSGIDRFWQSGKEVNGTIPLHHNSTIRLFSNLYTYRTRILTNILRIYRKIEKLRSIGNSKEKSDNWTILDLDGKDTKRRRDTN